jgi:hypothetical protein
MNEIIVYAKLVKLIKYDFKKKNDPLTYKATRRVIFEITA